MHPIAASATPSDMDIPNDGPGIPLQLQRLFAELQLSRSSATSTKAGKFVTWKSLLEKPSGKAFWKSHGNHIQHHQTIEHISNIEQEYYMSIVDPTFAPKNLPLGATRLLVQK